MEQFYLGWMKMSVAMEVCFSFCVCVCNRKSLWSVGQTESRPCKGCEGLAWLLYTLPRDLSKDPHTHTHTQPLHCHHGHNAITGRGHYPEPWRRLQKEIKRGLWLPDTLEDFVTSDSYLFLSTFWWVRNRTAPFRSTPNLIISFQADHFRDHPPHHITCGKGRILFNQVRFLFIYFHA